MKKDEGMRNISNMKVSDECFIELKVISIRKKISIQQIAQDILERAMSKKVKQVEVPEEV